MFFLSSFRFDSYPHGMYVHCKVVAGIPSQPVVEVSLRASRLEGDLDDDGLPEEKDMVQAFVVDTNKKGCFVRLSRQVEGRVILRNSAMVSLQIQPRRSQWVVLLLER